MTLKGENMESKLKVLIIDDFEMVRMMLNNSLKLMGVHNYHDSENGAEAWKKLENARNSNDPFNFIFCDWNMPEMSGIDFLSKCRNSEHYKSIPIIMVTAESEQNQIVEALKKGATDYIIKPISPEMLEKKVKKAIHRHTKAG